MTSDEPSVQKETAKVPAAPKTEAAADPDIPAGTEMVSMTVREALRDAMAEEMRADDRVFVMGEEVAQYQGAYKVSRELLQEFGAAATSRGSRCWSPCSSAWSRCC